jgi:Acetyltransferase (GNAT) domain
VLSFGLMILRICRHRELLRGLLHGHIAEREKRPRVEQTRSPRKKKRLVPRPLLLQPSKSAAETKREGGRSCSVIMTLVPNYRALPMSALRPTLNEDILAFRRLCACDRLEEYTCRPIVNGRAVARDQRREHWAYVLNCGRPGGWITLFDFNSRNRSAEFGYGLIPELRGRGEGKRLLACAFDLFFQTMDLNKLHCQTASFNIPSVRSLENLGLTRDGILRAHHELDGYLYDDYIYSLLRDEWLSHKQVTHCFIGNNGLG